MKNQILFLILLLTMVHGLRADVEISPHEGYGQVLLIEQETELVQRFLKPASKPEVWQAVQADLKPRHVWQEAYMVQIKILAFRTSHGMVGLSPVTLEPRLDYDSSNDWAETQRILTEIRFIRKALNIPGEAGPAPKVEGKKPIDVYNKLSDIEMRWDNLAGTSADSSTAFAQVLRLNEDINALMRALNVFDNAIPPAKQADSRAASSMAATFEVLEHVQRLQRLAGIQTVDFSAFRNPREVTPNLVFNMICLIHAEVQQIKAMAGFTHVITPPATYQENKTEADVTQLLGYVASKLRLIQHL